MWTENRGVGVENGDRISDEDVDAVGFLPVRFQSWLITAEDLACRCRSVAEQGGHCAGRNLRFEEEVLAEGRAVTY